MIVTSIGSLPFVDVGAALDVVLESCPDCPFWPQLPRRSFYEDMYVQYLEGVPSVVIDGDGRKIWIDTGKTDGIERFYEDVYAGNLDAFAISDRAAPGLYGLIERVGGKKGLRFVKGQLTGPFTLGMGLKDENGRPVIYDAAYFDIVKKALRMKAAWMARELKAACPESRVVIFFDEPAMASLGSAFVAVGPQAVTAMIREVSEGLDARVGVHCCGNTDWSVLLGAGIDIINYDAFNFMETPFYFRQELSAFLAGGGSVAPGIVPSSAENLAAVSASDVAELWRLFERHMASAGAECGHDMLVTTACGLGSLSEDEAASAMGLLRAIPEGRFIAYQK